MNILHDRRIELGLTLEEVGDKCGVGKSTVRKWENGMINNMGRDKIALLSKALQISPLAILNMEDDKNIILSKKEEKLVSTYRTLNETGQKKALERIEELTYIPKYCKETPEYLQPVAAHNDYSYDEEEQRLMQEDLDDL